MIKNRSRTRKKSSNDVVGGQWLPNLLTWGGVLLMLTGGIIAYPVLQNYLAPPDAQSLEFNVTLAPSPAAVALHPTVTAPPPLILPETELVIIPESATARPVEIESPPEPTPVPYFWRDQLSGKQEPTPTSTPTPTPALPTATATATPDPVGLKPNRMLIPVLNLDAPIVEVGWETQDVNGQLISNWIVPDSYAAGWHTTSALPGQTGNTVFSGHHNIHGEIFRDLEDLHPGDEIVVYTGVAMYYYTVTERHILEEKGQPKEVRLQNARFVMPTEDKRLTLVTCWPYTNNTHRLIIVAMSMQPTPTPTPMGQ